MTDNGLKYFDDYLPGTTYDCGSVSVGQDEITSFAKNFDPQPFHVDPAAAARGPFGGLIASGWHTAALVMRQLVDHYLSAEASLVWSLSATDEAFILSTAVCAVCGSMPATVAGSQAN